MNHDPADAWDRECEKHPLHEVRPGGSPLVGVIRAQENCIAYDTLAERLGIVVGSDGWAVAAKAAIGFSRPFGPCKHASPRCESGRRDYCTCDTCF